MPQAGDETQQAPVERVHRLRLVFAALAVTGLFGAVIWRLFTIQVLQHESHALSARRMRASVEPIPAYRGDIRLADEVIVARDQVDYQVGIDPKIIPRDKLQTVVKLVCDAAGKPAEHRRERLLTALARQAAGGESVSLAGEVSRSLVTELREALERVLGDKDMRGIIAEPRPRRVYPRESLAGPIVGVTDAEGRGVEGIEKSLGPYLSGRGGRREVLKDAPQKTRIFKVGSLEVAPVGGYDVYLTIESTLQAIVEEELEAGLQRERASAGLFVLMDCRTGDILAMASLPAYDPNRYGEYPEPKRKERRANRVVESLYEPGSVIKPFFAAYALEQGIARREEPIRGLIAGPVTWDGGRQARFGKRRVTDVHEHPDMTFEGAVIHSSNIGLAIVGMRLGKPGILDALRRFGFDRPSGIDLPAEASKEPWAPPMRWTPIYSATSASFGYEIMVSPIQLCRAFAALVNGGHLLRPRVVDRLVRGSETIRFPSRQVDGQPITAETSRHMREILRRVVEEGTAKWLKIEGFEFGGKTGTSDMAKGGYAGQDYLASFEGYAPCDDPRVVALCMVEKPRAHIYGAMVAGPIVAEVFRRMFRIAAETKLAMLEKRNRGGR
ncbi:MAG: penicillin-binding protein 2 [Planctomycetes bacterium]|nr:penicillin-binding protein 2 [Planctomycetota bacterium]